MPIIKTVTNQFVHSSASKLYIGEGSDKTAVPGVTSVSIDSTRDTIDATTRDDNGYTKKIPGLRSCSIKVDLNRIKNDATQEAFLEALDEDNVVLPVHAFDSSDGQAVEGDFVVTDISESQSKGELVTWSITLENYGEFEYVAASAPSTSSGG